MTALLDVERLNKRFGGLARREGCLSSPASRRDHRRSRPERRGQDDALQSPDRLHRARYRHRRRSTGSPLGGLAPHRDRQSRPRAHLPARPPVHGHERARERRGRLPCAARPARGACRARGRSASRSGRASAPKRRCRSTSCLTAICAGSRSRARWRRSPNFCCSTNPLPASARSEIEPLANLIRELHRSEGLTILIIEHKLREFMQLVRQRHRHGFRRDHRHR